MKSLLARAALLLTTAIAMSACGGSTAAPEQSKATTQPAAIELSSELTIPPESPIVIGISAPLTGPEEPGGREDADATITGIVLWKAAHGDSILGHKIEVRVEDDGCTEAAITAQAASRLLATPGLAGVIGPDCSAGARAALPLYAASGVVSISGSATESNLAGAQPQGNFFFRTAYRNSFQGLIGGTFIADELKARTAYLIDDGEVYGQDLMQTAATVIEQRGVTVIRDSAPAGTSDFSSVVARVLQANPDFVAFAGFNPDASLLYRQLRDAGYKGAFGAGDAAASLKTFVEPVGAEAAEGVFFVGCPLTLPDDFVAEFAKVHGSDPTASAFVGQYADAATILLDAIAGVAQQAEDGSLTIDRALLRDTIRSTTVQNGLSGHIVFDENGDRSSPETDLAAEALDLGVTACQVQGGKLFNLFP